MEDKSVSYIFNDVLHKVLHLSDDPARFGEYLTLQIRELVGVRTILISVCNENYENEFFSVYPPRRKEWATQQAFNDLIKISNQYTKLTLWDKQFDDKKVVDLLCKLEIDKIIALPLITAERNVGTILLIDLMDLYGMDEMMKLLSDLSGVFALVVRNSKLYINLEKQVENRTAELQKRNIELKESEERFKILFEQSPDAIILADIDSEIIVAGNNEAAKLFNCEKHQLIGMHHKDMHPHTRDEHESFIDHLIKSGIDDSKSIFESSIITSDGAIIPVDIMSQIVRIGNKDLYLGILRDITERKKYEKALLESEMRFKILFENAPDSMFLADPVTGKIVDANNAACRLFKKEKHELIGLFQYELHPNQVIDLSKDSFKDQFKQSEHHRTVHPVENTILCSDGTEIPVEILGQSIKIGNDVLMLGTFRDISERKKTENELLEKEVQYYNLANSGTALIWAAGLDKLCFYFNDPWLKFTGRKLEQELGNGWAEGVHPDDFDHCLNIYVSSFDKRIAFEMEYRMRRADGEYRWILDLGTPNYNGAGEFIGYIGHCFDITERKKADEALVEAQAILKAAMDNSQAGIAIADAPDGRLRYVNNAGLFIRGEVKEKIVDFIDINKYVSSWQMLDLDHRVLESDEVPLARAILYGETNSREFIIRRETGDDRIVLAKAAPIRNDKNEVIAAVVVFHDITDRKKTELALKESEKKLSTLFGSMTEMVVIHELELNEIGEAIDYRIIDCNDTFTQITGIEKETAKARLATEVYQMEHAPYLEEYAKVCITGQSLEYKTYYSPMDKHFLISAVSIGVNQFATITTDITAIEKTNEVITEKNKELENYIYVASHDLRSPLVNIQGFSQRLGRQTNELKKIVLDNIVQTNIKSDIEKIANEEIPKSLNFILSNVLKMDTLINGLLQLSRTGRIVMTIKKIDMNKLFKSILSAHNYELTEIEAKVQIDDLADCYGDENQLNQLFSNIINNAIKYRDKSRQLHLKISSHDFFNRVVYSVKDSGVGISARHLEKIWDVFYRVDSSSPEAGEGIGLSLARRIVDKHEGKIWAESEEGKGSTFYIELHRNEFGE